MNDFENILNYYKNELKWNPPFAEALSKYSPEALKGYLLMRESVQRGHLPKKTRELIFTLLDSLDDETSGAKSHAVAAVEAGLTMEELVEAFAIVTIVKGINVLCKSGIEAIEAAEKRLEDMKLEARKKPVKRFSMIVAVHLFLIKNNKILLLRRFNTGYGDGCYSVAAGHVDGDETIINAMIREAKEEINIDIDDSKLEIVQVMHRKCEDHERVDYFLACKEWTGNISNNEPHKCDDLAWFNINALPDNMVDYVKGAINNYINNVSFSQFGW
ncbi:hydrolase, NUDIX family [Clostridiales bacterium oral taxon 876 str. F0540]|nr:hydrolase, NUDIX family [Clostridiales bacterium oral taxon 876 str. F0540]